LRVGRAAVIARQNVGRINTMKSNKKAKRSKRFTQQSSGSQKAPPYTRDLPGGSTKSPGHRALNAIILFHLVAIVSWAAPLNNPPVNLLKKLVRPYILWAGLDQSWDMFSPNPRSANSYLKAAVITRNHHLRTWNFPRAEQMNLLDRFREDRYRTFEELIALPKNSPLLPLIAAHIAGFYANPGDSPDKVMIIEYRSEMDPLRSDETEAVPSPNVLYDDYLENGPQL
jgi:hypothetical protein